MWYVARKICDCAPGSVCIKQVQPDWFEGDNPTFRDDLVVSVDSALSTEESHAIADSIESQIENHFGATDISIHIEPETK